MSRESQVAGVLNGKHIVYVATVPFILSQLKVPMGIAVAKGAMVTTIFSPGKNDQEPAIFEGTTTKLIPIKRQISVFSDVNSLFNLYKYLKLHDVDIVHTISPKAGLLVGIAALLARVPIRIHTFTGQVWVDKLGIKKLLLKQTDKLIARLTTNLYADSYSQKQFIVVNGVAKSDAINVLGSGSLAGVDTRRFAKESFTSLEIKELRESLSIKEDDFVLIFVGRVHLDKGISELLRALDALISKNLKVKLLVVGPLDQSFFVDDVDIRQVLSSHQAIRWVGYKKNVENYIALSDVLVLPSYREGFGTVVIEAAAMEVPTIGSKIYGLTDSVIDGKTGILVEKKNTQQLELAIEELIKNENQKLQLGRNAKKRAIQEFDADRVAREIVNEYARLLVPISGT